MPEKVVRNAAEERSDAVQAARTHDDQVGVELICALDDRFGDPALIRNPERTRREAGLAGESSAVFRQHLRLSLTLLVEINDVGGKVSPAAEARSLKLFDDERLPDGEND